MIIWVLLAVCLGLFGWAGKRLGAIWASINLLGVVVSTFLSVKLGPLLTPLMAKVGDGDNFLLLHVAPALLVFLGLYLVFASIAYVTWDKVRMYYKYKIPDDWRVLWETMNSRVGICVGLATGIAHFAVIGLLAYTLGYWTVQLAGESSASGDGEGGSSGSGIMNISYNSKDAGTSVKQPGDGGGAWAQRMATVLNPLRSGLGSSGLEKFIAALDPLPDSFYHTADVLGIVYHNPTAARRLASYPGTIALSERPEFQAMVNDPDFVAFWESKPGLKTLLAHPHCRAMFRNTDIMTQVAAVDMADLAQFLKDGRTTKYSTERILGRWDIYIPGTVVEVGKNNPNLATDLANLALIRRAMVSLMMDVSFMATPDSQVMVKASLPDHQPLASLINGRPPNVRSNEPNAKIVLQGTWAKGSGEGAYTITWQAEGAKPDKLQVLPNDSMTTTFFGGALVFTRAD
jgi:hypothetical protein